jgi:hypothetical protein
MTSVAARLELRLTRDLQARPLPYPTEWNYDNDLGWVPHAEAVGT